MIKHQTINLKQPINDTDPITNEKIHYDKLDVAYYPSDNPFRPNDMQTQVVLYDSKVDDSEVPLSAFIGYLPTDQFCFDVNSYADDELAALVKQGVVQKVHRQPFTSGFSTYPVYQVNHK